MARKTLSTGPTGLKRNAQHFVRSLGIAYWLMRERDDRVDAGRNRQIE
jgi:hypothetical protein